MGRMDDIIAEILGGLEELFQVRDNVALFQRLLYQGIVRAVLLFEKLVLHVREHQCGMWLVDLHFGITVE